MTDETTASSDAFVWLEPPAAKTGPKTGRWIVAAERLRERPGEWALVATIPSGSASVAQSRLKALGCEVTTRRLSDGTAAIYARWPKEAS